MRGWTLEGFSGAAEPLDSAETAKFAKAGWSEKEIDEIKEDTGYLERVQEAAKMGRLHLIGWSCSSFATTGVACDLSLHFSQSCCLITLVLRVSWLLVLSEMHSVP